MKKRVIGAFALLVILIGALKLSSYVFGLLMMIVAMLGFYELINLRYKERAKDIEFVSLLGYTALGFITLNDVFYNVNISVAILYPMIGLTIPILFYNDSKKYNINDALYIFGIVLFLGFSFQTIASLAYTDIFKCIYIFILAFITDTYAYIGGKLIGKTKLTSISPKKTVEGTIVGSLMGIIVGVVYYNCVIGDLELFHLIILSTILVFLGEIGDLVFSSIKRYYNKKDFSNLILGHGGVLDRFDSVIFVALGMTLFLTLI